MTSMPSYVITPGNADIGHCCATCSKEGLTFRSSALQPPSDGLLQEGTSNDRLTWHSKIHMPTNPGARKHEANTTRILTHTHNKHTATGLARLMIIMVATPTILDTTVSNRIPFSHASFVHLQ
jgi:hypothetical protein